jgi:hypothetical protein
MAITALLSFHQSNDGIMRNGRLNSSIWHAKKYSCQRFRFLSSFLPFEFRQSRLATGIFAKVIARDGGLASTRPLGIPQQPAAEWIGNSDRTRAFEAEN